MDTSSMVVLGLGLSFVCSLGLIAMYQNYKRSQKIVDEKPATSPKKKRKKR